MLKKVLPFLITSCSLFIFPYGCASSVELTSQANRVEIIDDSRSKDLEFIGYVQGSSLLTGMFRQRGYDNALNELLNKAGNLGARYVVLDQNSTPKYWTTEQVIRGKAYKAKSQ